jgi:hypothetical protein
MFGRTKAWFKGLSAASKAGVILACVFLVGVAGAATSPSQSSTTKPAQPHKAQPATTTKMVTDQVTIPFTTSNVQDAALTQGTTKVGTAGVNGSKTQTWAVSYKDGRETSRKLVSEVVMAQPVNEVIDQGTMAPPTTTTPCTNGTYVNSAGNTVCSPESSPTPPPGASAQCVDGTYSFSQSRSGTCSHHGGVARWL